MSRSGKIGGPVTFCNRKPNGKKRDGVRAVVKLNEVTGSKLSAIFPESQGREEDRNERLRGFSRYGVEVESVTIVDIREVKVIVFKIVDGDWDVGRVKVEQTLSQVEMEVKCRNKNWNEPWTSSDW